MSFTENNPTTHGEYLNRILKSPSHSRNLGGTIPSDIRSEAVNKYQSILIPDMADASNLTDMVKTYLHKVTGLNQSFRTMYGKRGKGSDNDAIEYEEALGELNKEKKEARLFLNYIKNEMKDRGLISRKQDVAFVYTLNPDAKFIERKR